MLIFVNFYFLSFFFLDVVLCQPVLPADWRLLAVNYYIVL